MNPDQPTAESIAAAKGSGPYGPFTPPIQLDEAQMSRMTPEEIDQAFERMQLHTIMGGVLDDEGWPVDGKGRRLLPPEPGPFSNAGR